MTCFLENKKSLRSILWPLAVKQSSGVKLSRGWLLEIILAWRDFEARYLSRFFLWTSLMRSPGLSISEGWTRGMSELGWSRFLAKRYLSRFCDCSSLKCKVGSGTLRSSLHWVFIVTMVFGLAFLSCPSRNILRMSFTATLTDLILWMSWEYLSWSLVNAAGVTTKDWDWFDAESDAPQKRWASSTGTSNEYSSLSLSPAICYAFDAHF